MISSPKPGLRSRVQREFSGVGGGVGRGAGEDECSCFEMLVAGVVGGGLRGRHAGPVFDHWEIVGKVWQSERPVGDESGGGRSRMGGTEEWMDGAFQGAAGQAGPAWATRRAARWHQRAS